MAREDDVAAYVLELQGSATTYELQKLVYYAHGWSMAWDGVRLVDGAFGAWPKGPVLMSMWPKHAGRRRLKAGELAGEPSRLTGAQRETIDAVLAFYGTLGAEDLVELSHRERPWREARGSLGPTDKSDATLSEDSIRAYFCALARGSREKRIPEDVKAGVRMALTVPESEIELIDDIAGSLVGADADAWLLSLCPS